MVEIATHELVYTAIQGSVDRLKILELHHRLPRRTDADDDGMLKGVEYYCVHLKDESTEKKTISQNSNLPPPAAGLV